MLGDDILKYKWNQTQKKQLRRLTAAILSAFFLIGVVIAVSEADAYLQGSLEYRNLRAAYVDNTFSDGDDTYSPSSSSNSENAEDAVLPATLPSAAESDPPTDRLSLPEGVEKQETVDCPIYRENVLREQHSSPSRQVDFIGLSSINPDIVGWIEIPGTNIDYPLVWSMGSGDYYLSHTFRGESGDKPGCIFIDSNIQSGLDADNVIIHGHNLANGTMFSQLNRYKTYQYYAAHPYIFIHRPDGSIRTYQIASVVVTDGVDPQLYYWQFAGQETAQAYYDIFRQLSIFDTGVSIDASDERQTILLSTCYLGNHRRLILAIEV